MSVFLRPSGVLQSPPMAPVVPLGVHHQQPRRAQNNNNRHHEPHHPHLSITHSNDILTTDNDRDGQDLENANEEMHSGQELFVDPMMGSPLTIFVEKEVPNHDAIVKLIKKHGGAIGPNYSTVQYILVDPSKESGQNLFRQYQSKKTKIVLNAKWVYACVQAGKLVTFRENWGGFRVTGEEEIVDDPDLATTTSNAQPNTASATIPNSVHTTDRRHAPTTSSVAPTTSDPGPSTLLTSQGPPRLAAPTLPQRPQPQPQPQPQHQHQPPSSFATFPSSHNHHQQPTHQHPHAANQPMSPTTFAPWLAIQAPQPHSPSNHATATLANQHRHQPPQQITHLSQVHHRPPPMMPPAAYGVPSATGASTASPSNTAIRQSWYGVVSTHSHAGTNPATAGLGVQISNQAHAAPPQSFSFDATTTWDPAHVVYYSHQLNGFPDGTFGIQPSIQNTAAVDDGAVAGNSDADAAEEGAGEGGEKNRKRKRTSAGNGSKKSKYNPPPVTDPASLVPALAPPRRSPTPPIRVVKSTYGGNLFTSEDIEYLRKYIDWCVDMGEVLSLREICERLAIKAPHHTFYSWRRYCNKHKIKLSSYQMVVQDSARGDEVDDEELDDQPDNPPQQQQANFAGTSTAVISRATSNVTLGLAGPSQASSQQSRRNHSPTPPRSLHRSTTGKGIAFTEEDVRFLVKYLGYRRERDPSLNMPQFWNDLASKAPHHSRASWLKYWRRHKHEIEVGLSEGGGEDNPAADSGTQLLQVPQTHHTAKRQRYSQEDDVLLAKFWALNPKGTSDKLFQDFAKEHPHHPWKGWQEHHRLHKAQIDYFIKLHLQGIDLDSYPAPAPVKAGRPPLIREDSAG